MREGFSPNSALGEALAVSYSSGGGSRSMYMGKDIMGSVRSVTVGTGALEGRYEYDAFGQPYNGDLTGGMNLGYAGKPYDTATGLYNYGYRDYKPQAARFATVDPIRDGNNWYAYVNNDPVNWLDLWGLAPAMNTIAGDDVGSVQLNYAWPVTSGTITTAFGIQDPSPTGQTYHAGMDIVAPIGTPVTASTPGTVIKITTDTSFGNSVMVKNDDGYSTRYSHLDSFAPGLEEGSRVGQGNNGDIGTVGNTGISSGPHIDYRVFASDTGLMTNILTPPPDNPIPGKKD
jgi:RHS repeat-associated protein